MDVRMIQSFLHEDQLQFSPPKSQSSPSTWKSEKF